ncbi:CAP domain-containing protein [Candidatus Parcubacteria bacterium]|nr:CAP domain-containing protein [Candidatus Parcubacteria bacterium]
MKSSKNTKKNNIKKWIFYLILWKFVVKLFSSKFFKKDRKKICTNFKHFLSEEKGEIEELANGEEGIKRFCCDSASIFQEYFIPSEINGHKPKILRTKSLIIIAIILVVIKITVAGYLFFICPNQAKMSELITKNILELINVDRKNNGISELTNNSVLNGAALDKAKDMIEKDYFAHKSPDGRMSWNFINRVEYPYLFVGENLAMNFTSAQTAHGALMLSETHKKNILNAKYSDIGLAILTGVINEKKTNILVQIFGNANSVKPATVLVVNDQEIKKPVAILKDKIIEKEIPAQDSEVKVKPISITKEEIEKVEETKETESINKENNVKNAEKIENMTEIERMKKILAQNLKNDIIKKEIPIPVLSTKINNTNIDFSGMNTDLNEVKAFSIETKKEVTKATSIIKISHYIFYIALILITISLLINIVVKFGVQHKLLITESILAIVFIISLIHVKTSFLEYVLEKVFIV